MKDNRGMAGSAQRLSARQPRTSLPANGGQACQLQREAVSGAAYYLFQVLPGTARHCFLRFGRTTLFRAALEGGFASSLLPRPGLPADGTQRSRPFWKSLLMHFETDIESYPNLVQRGFVIHAESDSHVVYFTLRPTPVIGYVAVGGG